MNSKDWRPTIGTKVKIIGNHPHSGKRGEVVRHEEFLGRLTCVVRLNREDALNGHEAGIFSPKEITIQ